MQVVCLCPTRERHNCRPVLLVVSLPQRRGLQVFDAEILREQIWRSGSVYRLKPKQALFLWSISFDAEIGDFFRVTGPAGEFPACQINEDPSVPTKVYRVPETASRVPSPSSRISSIH